tara:strand:- start:17 stop:724 length:708 start_codon:yes stop_codon:yes gene_type:complete
MLRKVLYILVISGLLGACQKDPKLVAITTVDSEFQTGIDNWTPGLAGYTAQTDSATVDWQVSYSRLRPPLDTTRYGLKMQSTNDDTDLFMFVTKKVAGLEPLTNYYIQFDIALSTNVFKDSLDLLGKPGQSVFLKVGAFPNEPAYVLVNGVATLNVDKGVVSKSGSDLISLGEVNNQEIRKIFTLVHYNNPDTYTVRTNSNGELWLYLGTDSGYPGKTTYYIDRAVIKLNTRIDN